MKPLELRVACSTSRWELCLASFRRQKGREKMKGERTLTRKRWERFHDERNATRNSRGKRTRERERADLCNKRGSTRRGRTTVSSRAWAPRSPVCVASPEEQPGRRVASSRLVIVNPGSRFVCVPPTPTQPPPSHRSCYVPGQVRAAAPPGQPAIILQFYLYHRVFPRLYSLIICIEH